MKRIATAVALAVVTGATAATCVKNGTAKSPDCSKSPDAPGCKEPVKVVTSDSLDAKAFLFGPRGRTYIYDLRVSTQRLGPPKEEPPVKAEFFAQIVGGNLSLFPPVSHGPFEPPAHVFYSPRGFAVREPNAPDYLVLPAEFKGDSTWTDGVANGKVIGVGRSVTTPAGTYGDTVETEVALVRDEKGPQPRTIVDRFVFAKGVGLVSRERTEHVPQKPWIRAVDPGTTKREVWTLRAIKEPGLKIPLPDR